MNCPSLDRDHYPIVKQNVEKYFNESFCYVRYGLLQGRFGIGKGNNFSTLL